jgi:hypothetical protein
MLDFVFISTKKTIYFFPSSFVVVGFRIRDEKKSGSRISILDPQHC